MAVSFRYIYKLIRCLHPLWESSYTTYVNSCLKHKRHAQRSTKMSTSKPKKRGNSESLRKTQSRKSFDENWYQRRKKERIGTSCIMQQVRMFCYNFLTDVVDTKL
ncbi:hypothetical protein PILCRDRAFT_214528 [Piloderma croceum F 1598]|uniref:Uncharacterized protein n=1 Tax=Piloderma croceum (strain F 1598) TaxID=765440 RepID=A0A0C3GET9_PILCF|nr:hypothetical protein PILCRDRAFT_214528 [Piloderma croceum F 1598]